MIHFFDKEFKLEAAVFVNKPLANNVFLTFEFGVAGQELRASVIFAFVIQVPGDFVVLTILVRMKKSTNDVDSAYFSYLKII